MLKDAINSSNLFNHSKTENIMKRLSIIFFVLVLSCNLMGQDMERKGYIGSMLGPSFPYGDFASNSNYYDGYAETGLNISLLTFGYKIWRNFGITASWFGIANPIDYYGTEGMWGVGAIMLGPLYSIPIKEKLDLDFKGMFGYVLLTKQEDTIETSNAFGTGFEFGMMLRYDFTKKWCLMANLEAFNTKLDIQPDKDPKVSLINLSFGIAYRLK